MLSSIFKKPKPSKSKKKKKEISKILFFFEVSDQTLEDIFTTSF